MASKINRFISKMYGDKNFMPLDSKDGSDNDRKSVETKATPINTQKSKMPSVVKFFRRSKEYFSDHSADIKYLLLAIPIIVIFLLAWQAQKEQSLNTGAAAHQATITFSPVSGALPPAATFAIWINADSAVAFSDIELSFDPKLVKLTSEIGTQALNRKVKVTAMSEANTTGKASIVLALDPSQKANPPSGAFQIATLKFNNVTTNRVPATVQLSSSQMQLVASDASVFAITTGNISLHLNPTPMPSGTPIATKSPAPGKTPGPTQKPDSSHTPKPTSGTPKPHPSNNNSKILLSGVVTQEGDAEGIHGATVRIQKSGDHWWRTYKTVKTDNYGHFSIYLPAGKYTVTASIFGHATQSQKVELTDDSIVNFTMSSKKYHFFSHHFEFYFKDHRLHYRYYR